MTFEESFDYIRSLSSMDEESIQKVLKDRMTQPNSEYTLTDENSGQSFQIRYSSEDGFTIDAIF
jgi:hypothetical protein